MICSSVHIVCTWTLFCFFTVVLPDHFSVPVPDGKVTTVPGAFSFLIVDDDKPAPLLTQPSILRTMPSNVRTPFCIQNACWSYRLHSRYFCVSWNHKLWHLSVYDREPVEYIDPVKPAYYRDLVVAIYPVPVEMAASESCIPYSSIRVAYDVTMRPCVVIDITDRSVRSFPSCTFRKEATNGRSKCTVCLKDTETYVCSLFSCCSQKGTVTHRSSCRFFDKRRVFHGIFHLFGVKNSCSYQYKIDR